MVVRGQECQLPPAAVTAVYGAGVRSRGCVREVMQGGVYYTLARGWGRRVAAGGGVAVGGGTRDIHTCMQCGR